MKKIKALPKKNLLSKFFPKRSYINLPQFDLEEYWKKYEFTTPHIFCSSETENFTLNELLEYSDENTKEMWNNLSLGKKKY